ncbi:Gfo/Idh/MocA family oxidoreductase [Paraglaciecola aquimarina]|uniref:Gfo/Idh/MocA family oxidoreductase n=1 Tax=Paraglaciecola algarum TaxID=3050085 RepID=A0ABS9DAJ0_9ALTE|nr:Gfo/Idh/MocA family oxidoreductase [Paraglaciecola sp. G1-23]MCF2949968.1 Gfo/Idh/MocA family oxidoreductase [Paraglaciecola sp. G1-23]
MPIISRRDFITMTTASLAVSAYSPLSLSSTNHKNKLGVALVGLGYYSRDLLAPALNITEHCELRGIVTGSPDKIPVWQKKYGIKDSNVYSYETMHEIANNPDIDIVYVVVPTALHLKYCEIAANAGKHVWCEKPMAMTVKQCQQIIDVCNKNKVNLSVGYRMQHEPNTREMAAYHKSLPYGKIKSLSAFAGYGGNGGPADNWRMQKAMGGGAMYDMGVYAVNEARFLTGLEPISITASHEKSHPDIFKEVDETTYFTLDFANGLSADCGTSVVKRFNKARVECKTGWYQLSPMQSYTGVTGTTSDGKVLAPYSGIQQALQMDNDALAILNKSPVLVPGEEGLKDINIVNAAFESAKNGKAVLL